MAGVINDEDDNIDYDEDGNAIIPDKKVAYMHCCSCHFSADRKLLNNTCWLDYMWVPGTVQ